MHRLTALALGMAVLVGLGVSQAQDTKKAQPKPASKPAAKTAAKPAAKAANPTPSPAPLPAPTDPPAAPPVTDPTLQDMNSQASYGWGSNIGTQLARDCIRLQLDPKLVARGIADSLNSAKLAMTEAQVTAALSLFEKQLLDRQLAADKALMDQATAYLAEHKAKEGVKTTASGLQYRVLKAGQGTSPKPTDTVTIHYKGTLTDGTVFDSTEGKDPLSMPVNRFIPGWQEALVLMKVGDEYELTIPPDLAYGAEGTDGPIGPHAVLVFNLKLLDTKPASTEPPTP